GGAAVFSYLKRRGQADRVKPWDMARMSLELNFVNHILPTAGVSGVSYMTWRLSKLGVSSGRATLAQVVRWATSFAAFVLLLMISVLVVTLDSGVNRLTILGTSGLISAILIGCLVVWYVIDSEERLTRFSRGISRLTNAFGRRILRRKKELLSPEVVQFFFNELQDDYQSLKKEPRLLIRPFLWGIVFNLTEVSLFFFTFLSLGTLVNPAAILLAIGVASAIGAFLITPGGAGGYEAIMVLMLTSTGIPGAIVVAGVLLARIILILLTIGTGYLFYHLALRRYGKRTA
ncbi:MAG TPA: lysylphosphatidylglycerol synthase transmembrane domain-containing protein, partial [Candidatus Saccharimonadales bacterium]